jgi:hypothetical protein
MKRSQASTTTGTPTSGATSPRVVDREGDRYTERIVDAAGNVVRDVDEPLSNHRGHGTAKRRGSQPESGTGGL